MTIDLKDKLELTKILIGLLIALVGALWTYTVYYESERKQELDTLIKLGNSIAGMNVTCKGDYGGLAKLSESNIQGRKSRCYQHFHNAYQISLAAVITIRKPFLLSDAEWVGSWENLQDAIASAASKKYDDEKIEDAWTGILIAKGLKLPE